MANIAYIAAAELEKDRSAELWTDISFVSSDPPLSGVSGAHGRVYETTTWSLYRIAFDDTPIVTVKARIKIANSVDNEIFLQIMDSPTTAQIHLIYRSSGLIEVRRSATLLASGGSLSIATHYELEVRTKISSGGGMVAVNVDGNQIICVPGSADTDQSGSGVANRWSIGNSALGLQFDDCVVDRSGEYLGLGQVETLMPNSIGDLSELTPDTIAANYSRVNDKPHDDDTSYVASTGNQTDTYQFEDISLPGTPMGAMLSAQAKHTTGSPTLKLVCRIDGENYESPVLSASSSTYRFMLFHPYPVNPATGEPWTVETLNAAQWGVHCLETGIRVTQVALQVYMKTVNSDRCLSAGNRNYCLSVDNDFN